MYLFFDKTRLYRKQNNKTVLSELAETQFYFKCISQCLQRSNINVNIAIVWSLSGNEVEICCK